MTFIFGNAKPGHLWCPLLTDWVKDTTSPFHSIAANIEYDDRVPVDRFQTIEKHVVGDLLADGLDAYFSAKVRDAATPEFNDPSGGNCVKDTSDLSELVWILDLGGLYTISGFLDKVERRRGRILDNCFATNISSLAESYFDSVLGPINDPLKPTEAQKEYLQLVLAELADWPRHPIWTTSFEHFHRYLPEGPERWLEVVGIRKVVSGRHIVAVKYPRNNRVLYRPCFADAATNADHYPTPSGVSVDKGGRAMNLSDSSIESTSTLTSTSITSLVPTVDSTPLPEYIHIHGAIEDAQIAGIGKTIRSVGNRDIAEYRKRQKQQLIDLWPDHAAVISKWPD